MFPRSHAQLSLPIVRTSMNMRKLVSFFYVSVSRWHFLQVRASVSFVPTACSLQESNKWTTNRNKVTKLTLESWIVWALPSDIWSGQSKTRIVRTKSNGFSTLLVWWIFSLHKTIYLAWSFSLFSLSTSSTRIFSRIPRSDTPHKFTSRVNNAIT